ncbi:MULTISPECIES: OadG family protein [Idiomarinaceae]|uniref:Probable oxaloacetate decarboxylase gamma chain n=4 Tax=Pseudidiomarina TaxID=2800384 RepID=A0A368UQ14_9GAMM|nr:MULTISPECIES: OadG family transporter subunit [Idiomarinaceae]MDT7524531.1 OadG family transporter subunit [Pseudidiomarina sp. GXY010]MDX1526473.1 OadG family transporter subunit [Pseudidiomarina maritima]MRJ42417.1 oxaloacetate decarboxylase [Idiomarina sp. FeN1]NCU58031.1 oxaloacetate decarboxylase [Idiomarina sp. FenA--70]NCU60729.1 oxaloacetate decarboxylase [Idiomarina sp. FenBw--71]
MGELFTDALMIMVTGMVTVFAFLSLLIGAMAVLRKLADAPEVTTTSNTPATSAPNAAEYAAIAAAVHQYRRNH